jgi:hypothetical protein
MAMRFKLLHRRQIERGGDQQDGVGAHGARFGDLIGIDHEILAQHRQGAGGAGRLQIFRAALEILAVGQHRQAGRAVLPRSCGRFRPAGSRRE